MAWPNPSITRWLMNSRRSTTGDLRRFAVHEIAAHGLKLRGASFGWQWSQDGEVQALIGASVQGGEDGATLALDYTLNGSPVTHRIRLAASPCRFGGVRWLAICPDTGRRVAHLYIGGSGALSRHAYRLKFDFAAAMHAGSIAATATEDACETENRRSGVSAPPKGNARPNL